MKLISSVPALCWDPDARMLVKVVRVIDEHGREWESYNDGPYVPIEAPEEVLP